jgi:glycosyltransferase involved in cell wall biosynthesis
MQISVIIPTYPPHYEYLDIAVASVDFPGAEIIIVNDSDKYQVSHINAISLNREDGDIWGTGKARNIGVAASGGECIVFLDSDDYLLSGALGAMWDMYKKTGAIVYGSLVRGDTNGLHIPKIPHKINPTVKGNRPYCCLIPRKYHIPFVEEIPTWEDLVYEADQYVKGYPMVRIDRAIYYYRWNENGRRSLGDRQDINKQMQEFMQERYGAIRGV